MIKLKLMALDSWNSTQLKKPDAMPYSSHPVTFRVYATTMIAISKRDLSMLGTWYFDAFMMKQDCIS